MGDLSPDNDVQRCLWTRFLYVGNHNPNVCIFAIICQNLISNAKKTTYHHLAFTFCGLYSWAGLAARRRLPTAAIVWSHGNAVLRTFERVVAHLVGVQATPAMAFAPTSPSRAMCQFRTAQPRRAEARIQARPRARGRTEE
jgi:uncharacterized membrane protein YfbV (UPF0208 family)